MAAQILKQTILKIIVVRASTAGMESAKVILLKMFQATIRNFNLAAYAYSFRYGVYAAVASNMKCRVQRS